MTGEADPSRYRADLVMTESNPELLRVFNVAGVLAPADIHLALRLCRMADVTDDLVGLAVALAGRAPRVGHVSVDLAEVRSSVVVGEEDASLDLLPWPEPELWVERVKESPLVAHEEGGPHVDGATAEGGRTRGCRPLHLAGSRLYLDRYWRDEIEVADELRRRAVFTCPPHAGRPDEPGVAWLADRLDSLFPGSGASDQRSAAAMAMSGALAVIAGGPGTGKTTTVARLLALVIEDAVRSEGRPPLVGLAAPTGKAAARLEEAIRAEVGRMTVPRDVRLILEGLSGVTVHRLLGYRPDRTSRFRHHRGHRLPHDVVVVDEASMVSLALMARLVEAVSPGARLILMGDPEQLVSVEAGAVLADIVGSLPDISSPADGGHGRPSGAGAGDTGENRSYAGEAGAPYAAALARRTAFLRTNHRFTGELADLASAVREGDSQAAVAALRQGASALRWFDCQPSDWSHSGDPPADARELHKGLVAWASGLVAAARDGQADAALLMLQRHRLLCAHREGPAGVKAWNRRMEEWLTGEIPDLLVEGPWYPGRPIMVTANDYSLRLFNGDTGVVVAPDSGSGLAVAFPQPGGVRMVSPYRLSQIDTVYATTVHKSQGSEFDSVTLVLPADTSRLLTRELLYTAVTRARTGLQVVGTEAAIRRAVERRLARGSGLAARLWSA